MTAAAEARRNARAARRELLPRALAEPKGVKRLGAIDFYERCALARRKAAIRDFDAAPDSGPDIARGGTVGSVVDSHLDIAGHFTGVRAGMSRRGDRRGGDLLGHAAVSQSSFP